VKETPGSLRRASVPTLRPRLGRTPAPADWSPAPRVIPARVVIRPARPDDLEDATLLERRVWGGLSATLNELQRRLFALPEAFLLAELQRPGLPRGIVGLANGVIWTRDFPRSPGDYEKLLPSTSHNPRGDVLYIASLGVDPSWRGRGIACRILQEIAEVGRRRHLKYMRLITNSRSEPLYQRAGFQVVRPLHALYRQHRDRMPQPALMEMPLL
jgi:ribosomal protein S18 acetylase RimI-like enzyme